MLNFFRGRLKTVLEGYELRYDIVDAIISAELKNIPEVLERARALQKFRDTTSEFAVIFTLFKRMNNIVEDGNYKFDKKLLVEKAEKELFKFHSVNKKKAAEFIKEKNYKSLFSLLIDYSGPVNIFFDEVLINCDDEKLASNRKALIDDILDSFRLVIAFSKIVLD